jgi:flagellar hook-basal body complex protein FliE
VTIPPIGPIAPITSVTAVSPVSSTGAAVGASGASFASQLANGLNQVQSLQNNADNLAVQAADGSLSDPAQYMMASTEASLATQLTVAIRDKAVDAFNEIMRLQA